MFAALRGAFKNATAADLSWVLNAYTIVYAAMLIPAGGFSDTYGRKPVFLLGVAIFIAASAACGLAPSVPMLVFARVLQAFGASMLTPASLSLVLAAFPAHKRAMTVSAWGAVGGFAAAIGPSLGAYIAQTVSWRWAFYINVPVGALSLFYGLRLLPPSSGSDGSAPKRRIDIVGMLLLISAVSSLALALVEIPSPEWSHGELIAAFGVTAASMTVFIIWAACVRDPLIDLTLFRHPTYSAVNAATLTFGVAFAMMFFSLFFFLTEIWRFDETHAGVSMIAGPLTVIPVAVVSGRLAGRYGHRRFWCLAPCCMPPPGFGFISCPGPLPLMPANSCRVC